MVSTGDFRFWHWAITDVCSLPETMTGGRERWRSGKSDFGRRRRPPRLASARTGQPMPWVIIRTVKCDVWGWSDMGLPPGRSNPWFCRTGEIDACSSRFCPFAIHKKGADFTAPFFDIPFPVLI